MQTPTVPFLQSRFKNSSTNGYLSAHPVGEVIRSLFLSSVGWVAVAFAVYKVFSMVLGSR